MLKYFVVNVIEIFKISNLETLKNMEGSVNNDKVLGKIFSDLPVKSFPTELEFNVRITEVISSQCFYGHLINKETLTALHELNTLLVDYDTYETASFKPKKDELCVTKCEDDGKCYRAVLVDFVEDMGEKKAKVRFAYLVLNYMALNCGK